MESKQTSEAAKVEVNSAEAARPTRREVLKTIGIGAAAVASTGAAVASGPAKESGFMSKLIIHADEGKQKISRHIYGHFAEHLGRCIYEGIWVGTSSPIPNTRGIRNDVLAALKKIRVPNLRWPGGCFADTYHWKDGIGPRENRPSIVNINWGGVTENNHFGTHEFLDLCAMLECEPYICGNVGSGTVQEMAEWLEYITMPGKSPMSDWRRKNGREEAWPLRFWAVGNENWGCGGNMRPQYYADEYRRFQTFCRNFSGKKLYKVACGQEDEWNEILLRDAGGMMDGLSVHYYTLPGSWDKKGSATQFGTEDWFVTLQKAAAVEGFIHRTATIMDRYDPNKRIGMVMDEWGTWYDVEPGTNPGFLYQQNTLRDALVAGLTLNIFNTHADRLHMANIAQTINVLQAMILTEGPKMLCTPTYHVFDMYKVHQDATLLPSVLECPSQQVGKEKMPLVSASASRDGAGKIHVSLCNLHPDQEANVTCELRGSTASSATGQLLTASVMNAHNAFDKPANLAPVGFEDFKLSRSGITAKLPPKSVVVLEIA